MYQDSYLMYYHTPLICSVGTYGQELVTWQPGDLVTLEATWRHLVASAIWWPPSMYIK